MYNVLLNTLYYIKLGNGQHTQNAVTLVANVQTSLI